MASEAERQELGAASGVAINQWAESDLMGNAGAGEPFGDDADHDSEHGCTAVKTLCLLQLIEMNVASRCVLKPVFVGLWH